MPRFLTLIPVAPANATLELALYGATYRVTGKMAGQRVFGFDLSPTFGFQFEALIQRTLLGEDGAVNVKPWHAAISSTGGVLTFTSSQLGDASQRVSWRLGRDAAEEVQAWIKG